ncbi:SEMA4B isoform 20, partial [Pongo abelii]
HIIEELQIFSSGQPVQNLLLDTHRGLLYAASHSGVVQVPMANCSLYRSCGDCLLARDPYCAWSGSSCKHVSLYQPELAARIPSGPQAVDPGHRGSQCQGPLQRVFGCVPVFCTNR